MADMIAPGYVKKFEDSSKVLSVSDIQDIYINKFRAYTDEQVGDIDTIECKVTDIQAVSNIEDVQQQFADNGVKGVSQYRSVEADWDSDRQGWRRGHGTRSGMYVEVRRWLVYGLCPVCR